MSTLRRFSRVRLVACVASLCATQFFVLAPEVFAQSKPAVVAKPKPKAPAPSPRPAKRPAPPKAPPATPGPAPGAAAATKPAATPPAGAAAVAPAGTPAAVPAANPYGTTTNASAGTGAAKSPATATTEGGASETRNADGSKVLKFGEVEIEGRLKSPQIVYFLRRVRAEFAAQDLGHRSFFGELQETGSQVE